MKYFAGVFAFLFFSGTTIADPSNINVLQSFTGTFKYVSGDKVKSSNFCAAQVIQSKLSSPNDLDFFEVPINLSRSGYPQFPRINLGPLVTDLTAFSGDNDDIPYTGPACLIDVDTQETNLSGATLVYTNTRQTKFADGQSFATFLQIRATLLPNDRIVFYFSGNGRPYSCTYEKVN